MVCQKSKKHLTKKFSFYCIRHKKIVLLSVMIILLVIIGYVYQQNSKVSADSNNLQFGSIIRGESNTSGPDKICLSGMGCLSHAAYGSDGDRVIKSSYKYSSSYYVVGIAMWDIKNQEHKDAANRVYSNMDEMVSAFSKYGLADIVVEKCTRSAKIADCQQVASYSDRYQWIIPPKVDTSPSEQETRSIMKKNSLKYYFSDTKYWVDEETGAEFLTTDLYPRSKSENLKGIVGYKQIYNIPTSTQKSAPATTVKKTFSTFKSSSVKIYNVWTKTYGCVVTGKACYRKKNSQITISEVSYKGDDSHGAISDYQQSKSGKDISFISYGSVVINNNALTKTLWACNGKDLRCATSGNQPITREMLSYVNDRKRLVQFIFSSPTSEYNQNELSNFISENIEISKSAQNISQVTKGKTKYSNGEKILLLISSFFKW